MHGSSVIAEAPRRDADNVCAYHCHHSVIHVAAENNRVQRFAYAANHGDGDDGDDGGGAVVLLLPLAWRGGYRRLLASRGSAFAPVCAVS